MKCVKCVKLAALALGALTLSPAPAQPQEWKPWKTVSGWRIEHSDRGCLTAGKYENGTTLAFVIRKTKEFQIVFGREEWKIPEGVYRVRFEMDGRDVGVFRAYGDGELVKMEFNLSVNNIEALRHGRTLFATLGKQRYAFNLVGTRDMLPELVRCALAPPASQANPFADAEDGSSPGDRVIPSRNPFD